MRKMKKSERIELIHKRAHELAKSGKYTDWLSIEYALSSDGLTEVRSELDRDYLRKELDELCKIAKSDSEIQNRIAFEEWIKNFIEPNINLAKKSYQALKYYLSVDKFYLIGSKKELHIQKVFGQKGLIGDLITEESDGKRYRTYSYYSSQKDFDQFETEDFISLVKKVL